jgi:hypothetical protein
VDGEKEEGAGVRQVDSHHDKTYDPFLPCDVQSNPVCVSVLNVCGVNLIVVAIDLLLQGSAARQEPPERHGACPQAREHAAAGDVSQALRAVEKTTGE